MDCMTISTFRSLEQQAIRQFREIKSKEINHKNLSRETYLQDVFVAKTLKNSDDSVENSTTNTSKVDYYA